MILGVGNLVINQIAVAFEIHLRFFRVFTMNSTWQTSGNYWKTGVPRPCPTLAGGRARCKSSWLTEHTRFKPTDPTDSNSWPLMTHQWSNLVIKNKWPNHYRQSSLTTENGGYIISKTNRWFDLSYKTLGVVAPSRRTWSVWPVAFGNASPRPATGEARTDSSVEKLIRRKLSNADSCAV